MELVILEQSAAIAVAHAIDQICAVQDIDYKKLCEQLLKDGQRIGAKQFGLSYICSSNPFY